jgi:hypothetical protein
VGGLPVHNAAALPFRRAAVPGYGKAVHALRKFGYLVKVIKIVRATLVAGLVLFVLHRPKAYRAAVSELPAALCFVVRAFALAGRALAIQFPLLALPH